MNLEEKCDRSIFEHEKLLIRFAYHNAALKFGLIPNDQKLKQNSKNPIPKYINKNQIWKYVPRDSKNHTFGSEQKIGYKNNLCRLKFYPTFVP